MVNCPHDDKAECCGNCPYPVVLIATHHRLKITCKNIESLLNQTLVPKIVVVTSDQDEAIYFAETYGIESLYHKNEPLGAKWQYGVRDANPLIILGSDDILAPDYVEQVCRKIKEGFDFIGTTAWYSYDEYRNRVYDTCYINKNQDFPIGSGRAYSSVLLNKMKFKLFDTSLGKKLDDFGYYSAIKQSAKTFIIRSPEILAVKGDWAQMNPMHKYLTSKNIQVQNADLDVLKKFDYVPD